MKPSGEIGTPSTGSTKGGRLEAYVCAECGYFESYLKDLGVAFEELHHFRWLNPSTDEPGPYR